MLLCLSGDVGLTLCHKMINEGLAVAILLPSVRFFKENKMVDMTMTKAERERDQLGEKIFENIYSVLIDNKLNIDPLANELGDTINDFVDVVIAYSESNKE